jgi:dipeptidyl-peptidase-4
MRVRAVAAFAAAFFAFASAPPAGAAQSYGIDDIVNVKPFIGRLPASITWAPDGKRFLYASPSVVPGVAEAVRLFDAATHEDRELFKARALGKGARPVAEYVWSPSGKELAFLDGGDLKIVTIATGAKRTLATGADDPQWSPAGDRLAYVHANDLYTVRADGSGTERLTHDGSDTIQNGAPDWVYSEELAMRHAYRWSPDGTRIAYARFDDAKVTDYPIVDFLALDNTVIHERYPLAGEANPRVELHVVSRVTGVAIRAYATAPHDDYVAGFSWSPAGVLYAQILDRSQKRVRFIDFGSDGASARTSYTLADPMWVDTRGDTSWIDANHVVIPAPHENRPSLAVVDVRNGAMRFIGGRYAVLALDTIDVGTHLAYITVAYPTRGDRSLAAVDLTHGDPRIVAGGGGTHAATFAPTGRYYVERYSRQDMPPIVRVVDPGNGSSFVLGASRSLAAYGLSYPQRFSVPSRFGSLDAWRIVPPDFDPAKKYPTIMYVYGGPATSTTENAWSGDTLFYNLLAKRGYVVVSVDGPASQVDNLQHLHAMYHNLGPASLAGQQAAAAYLKAQSWVDPARLGLWGWSFGGYETTYAMTHEPDVWKAGIAGGTVADWKLYDTIYTERYMGKPQDDPAAYARSSVFPAVKKLKGRILFLHGTSDDNVHMANLMMLQSAFERANRRVDMHVYPRSMHGVRGVPQQRDLYATMLDFWTTRL